MNVQTTEYVTAKLRTYIDTLDDEIGGFGYAELSGDVVKWHDVFLVPQIISPANVDFDGDGIGHAIERAASDGVLGREDFVWVSWHSHNKMNTFWSATDEECIRTYGRSGIPALLSYVGNHKSQYECRLDLFNVGHHGITVPQVTMDSLTIGQWGSETWIAEALAEIDLNCKREAPKAKQLKAAEPWPKPDKSATQAPQSHRMTEAQARNLPNRIGCTIEEAFEIKELVGLGMKYTDARDDVLGVDEDEFINVAGEVVGGFDSMAWSMS